MIPNPTMGDIIRHLNNRDYVTAKALILDCYCRNGAGKITEALMEAIMIPLLENSYFNPINHKVTVTVRLIENVPQEEPKPVPVKGPNEKTKKEKARQETMDFPITKNPKKGKHSNMLGGGRFCLNEEKQKEFVIDWYIHRFPLILLSGKYNITTQTVKNYIKRYRNGTILKGWYPSKK